MTVRYISRSGGHAVINWIIGCLSEKSIKYTHRWRDTVLVDHYIDGVLKKKTKKRYIPDPNYEILSLENKFESADVTIIRSPKNLYASLLKNGFRYCDEHEIYALYMNHISADGYKIFYDEWFKSKSYRKKIASDLGLEFSDQNLNTVLYYGEGSSFDGDKFDNHAQNMKVLTRYKNIDSEPNWLEPLDKLYKKTTQQL